MARNGKIARLPFSIREELNQRLNDGDGGEPLLEWLNSLEAVQKVVVERFKGVPIGAQNLTEWRQGGFVDWCECMEARQLARDLQEEAEVVDDQNHQEATGDHLAAVLMLEFARIGRARLRSAGDEEE